MNHCTSCGLPAHDGPCPPVAPPQRNMVLQGRYELIGLLGEGGMGTVYMARDLRLHNRPCVVKKLRDDFFREDERQQALSLFNREADVLSTLSHPNIVHILDYFEENYNYFLVMEYVEGMDLHNVLKERGEPFSEEQVLGWAGQICDVLEYLHNNEPPIIYRDLKPSNIMIDVKGRVKLVDFGIARPHDDDTEYTHVVSAGYSPPEQYRGSADKRSDVYALGATMHYLLTGEEPLALHVCSPASVSDQISERTNSIVERATAQNPDERYQTAKDMQADLQPPEETVKYPEKRNKRLELVIGLAVLLIGGLMMLAYYKLNENLSARQDQIQELSKLKAEREQMSQKLRSYSRAAEAQEKAISEWRELSKHQPGETSTDIAAQAAAEVQMTDPEGLLNPEEQQTLPASLPNLFGPR